MFPEYQWAINRYLNDFGAGFQIVKVSRSFAGGRQPSATYAVELRGFEVPLGDAGTPVGTPSFRTVLSSGDKSTLALAFFLARSRRLPTSLRGSPGAVASAARMGDLGDRASRQAVRIRFTKSEDEWYKAAYYDAMSTCGRGSLMRRGTGPPARDGRGRLVSR